MRVLLVPLGLVALALVALAIALLPGGCADDACGTPASELAYTCESQASTANACVGGPMLGGTQHDADKNYPVGCFAGVPACVDGKPVIDDCECISGFTGNSWVCGP